jgi:hypothetical protein
MGKKDKAAKIEKKAAKKALKKMTKKSKKGSKVDRSDIGQDSPFSS